MKTTSLTLVVHDVQNLRRDTIWLHNHQYCVFMPTTYIDDEVHQTIREFVLEWTPFMLLHRKRHAASTGDTHWNPIQPSTLLHKVFQNHHFFACLINFIQNKMRPRPKRAQPWPVNSLRSPLRTYSETSDWKNRVWITSKSHAPNASFPEPGHPSQQTVLEEREETQFRR